MTQGGEQILAVAVSNYLKAVSKERPVWYAKIHGGPYQRSGIWDFLLTVNGQAGAIELKNPNGGNDLSALQHLERRRMARAGTQLLVARSLDEVRTFVQELLFEPTFEPKPRP